MTYLWAFLFAGFLCFLGQLLYEYTKLTPGHITSIFVVVGVLLESFNIYDFFLTHCGGGAMTPITNFGHVLAHSALEGAKEEGFIGILKGLLKNASFVLSLVTIVATLAAVFTRPKGDA